MPRQMKIGGKGFVVTRETPIVLSASCDASDYFAATLMRKEIEKRSSVEVAIEKHGTPVGLDRYILLARLEDLDGRSFAKPKQPPPKALGDQGYLIESTPERVVVGAASAAGLYYGVQTLRQVLEAKPARATVPGARIVDWPGFAYRGVMLDVSRGRVPTLDTIFEIIELLGTLKANVFQLYVEHTFSFRGHPEIAQAAGALTHEDILRIDERARKHHVQLQPNLQSFGHMERILGLAPYKKLAESDRQWTIAPGQKETYRFLDELYAEYLPCFSASLFNADCDETHDLGTGKSSARAAKVGVGRVYLDHIVRLRSLAKKYRKRLAIWGDIVLDHPKVIRKIPKDILMLNWGYGARHAFASTRKFARAKLEHWVCPGVNSWRSLFPRIEVACRNISGFATHGAKTRATGLLNTDWGDGGHPNLPGHSFHGYAFGAEASWSGPRRDPKDFDTRFSWGLFRNASGLMGKIFRTLGQTNAAFGADNYTSVPFQIYWAEFPYGEALKGAKRRALNAAERAARQARAQVSAARQFITGERVLLDELDFAARQTILACAKARIASQIVKAVPKEAGVSAAGFGGRGLPASLVAEVADILREWKLQRDEFERLWMVRARRSEIDLRLRLYRDREQELARLAAPAMRRPDVV
jgi:hypothetical protein